MRAVVFAGLLGFALGCLTQYVYDKQHCAPDPLDCIAEEQCPPLDEAE